MLTGGAVAQNAQTKGVTRVAKTGRAGLVKAPTQLRLHFLITATMSSFLLLTGPGDRDRGLILFEGLHALTATLFR